MTNEFEYNEKIHRFKELAKQYYGMQNEILRLQEELSKIEDRMTGYRSPSWDKIGSSPSRHEQDLIGLIQKKQEVEEQIEEINSKCNWVKKCINNIQSPYNRSIANMLYLDGYSINEISQEYEITPRHVFETTKQSLGEALTEDLMLEYLMLEKD